MQHKWIALVPYVLTDDEARRLSGHDRRPINPIPVASPPPDDRPVLRVEAIIQKDVAIGCWTCEQPYNEKVAAEPCPGEPASYDAQGEPIYREENHGREA